jgi:hypothetical protein
MNPRGPRPARRMTRSCATDEQYDDTASFSDDVSLWGHRKSVKPVGWTVPPYGRLTSKNTAIKLNEKTTSKAV